MILTSKNPEHFPKARDFHTECGAYQLQAALHAFGKDAPVEALYISKTQQKLDWSFPWNMPRILARFNIPAKTRFWTRRRFSQNLIKNLEADEPALFVVRSIQGNGCLHWISAWGFDPQVSEFLCYDSQLPSADSPYGNTRYAADLLEKSLPWRGTFAVLIRN